MRTRQTHNSTRTVLHIINHISKTKLSVVLLNPDAEKAFDSVRWDLFQVMIRFGFCETFIQCTRTLYSIDNAMRM